MCYYFALLCVVGGIFSLSALAVAFIEIAGCSVHCSKTHAPDVHSEGAGSDRNADGKGPFPDRHGLIVNNH